VSTTRAARADRHEHDLGLAHDPKVLSRRRMFHLAGAAGASALVAACAGGGSTKADGHGFHHAAAGYDPAMRAL